MAGILALGNVATRLDLTLQPGATLIFTIDDLAGTNLTNAKAEMSIKSRDRFPVDLLTVTEVDSIDLGGATGIITVTLTPVQTALIAEDAVWDLLITYQDQSADKLRFGSVTFVRPVTVI